MKFNDLNEEERARANEAIAYLSRTISKACGASLSDLSRCIREAVDKHLQTVDVKASRVRRA